jgi:hypothetical protein
MPETNYPNRQFIIFNVSEIDKVDFTKVLETSAETLRKSVDGTKTFVKWDDANQQPAFISLLTTAEGPYTYNEILEILATEEWTNPNMFNI